MERTQAMSKQEQSGCPFHADDFKIIDLFFEPP